jgi:hypothetical protein
VLEVQYIITKQITSLKESLSRVSISCLCFLNYLVMCLLTILVHEGQYIITKQINIPNRVVIKGE